MKNKTGTIASISLILIAVTAIWVFILNREIPFMMDDLWYSTLLYSDEPIHSFSDIIKAQVWHWNNWGGRSMTHGLLQMILLCGETFADILNTIFVFVLSAVISLTASTATGKIKNIPAFILTGAGLVIGLNANWKMSMFWEAGAVNYLYITVFILLFIFCYLREIPSSQDSTSPGSQTQDSGPACSTGILPGITFWIIPLSVLAGWSNENMGPTCFIISILVMLKLKKSGRRIRAWMPLGSAFSLAGSVMCIIAPGNFVRSATIPERGVLWNAFLRCYYELTAAFRFQIITLILLAAILVISITFCRIKLSDHEKILLLGALLSWGAMILSPHYPDRATFGTMCLMIVVIISRSILVIRQKKEAALPLFLCMLIIWGAGMYNLGEFLAVSLGWIV